MLKLFLDMDGVLMNYEGAIEAAGVVRYREGAHWISRPRSEWPAEMIQADKDYVECMLRPDFWSGIKPMDDAGELWDYCQQFNPEILTAAPTDRPGESTFAAIRGRVANDKRNSILIHFDALFPAERIHVCLRHEKARYAEPGAVLVDDTPGNCEEWRARGGIAILHTSAADTIRQISDLLKAELRVAPVPYSALRDRTSKERKAEPIHSGVMLYFPDALAAVARISKAGNDKHNPGEPLHWSRGKSNDHGDSAARHLLTLTGIDPDSGELEAANNAWRSLAILQVLEEKRLRAAGIKPYSGIVT